MRAAAAMIACGLITPPVIVIEHQVLALITYDVGNAVQVTSVLGDHEGGRLV